MAYSKTFLLDKAIGIAKAYARGGGSYSPEIILRKVFEELKKINEEIEE